MLVESQIEWNLKVKSEISVCTAIVLNNHSNPINLVAKLAFRMQTLN